MVLSLAIGYPVAWYAARHAGRWRGLILVLLVLPFWISYLMRMFAWTNLLAENGYATRALHSLSIDTLFQKLGLLDGSDWLGGQHIAVILALVYGYVPYLILPLFAGARPHRPALHRGRARPRRLAGRRLLARRRPALEDRDAGRHRPHRAADVRRLLHARPHLGLAQDGDPGQRDQRLRAGRARQVAGAALTILLSAFLLIFMLYYLRVVRADQRAAAGVA